MKPTVLFLAAIFSVVAQTGRTQNARSTIVASGMKLTLAELELSQHAILEISKGRDGGPSMEELPTLAGNSSYT